MTTLKWHNVALTVHTAIVLAWTLSPLCWRETCRRPCGSGTAAWRPWTPASCRTLQVGRKHEIGTIFTSNVICQWRYLIVSVCLLAPGYRGEWCHGPWGAAGGWQRWLGPEPPCGSRSSRPAPAPRSSWGMFANGSACPWSASRHEASTWGWVQTN